MQTHFHNHHITPPLLDVPAACIPSEMDEYLFDLRGFVVIKGALDPEHVAACNACVDQIPLSVERNTWYGHVHRENSSDVLGRNYQQIYEAGAPFERIIDHPNFINYVTRFVGGHDMYEREHGPIYIDENFFNIRGPGESIYLHAGGHDRSNHTIFGYHNGRFHCGQVNVLIAFTDIGPGDGATMVIPGSHKSNFIHPQYQQGNRAGAEGVEGAVEVHMKAGDALLFVDALSHGSAQRRNQGERRIGVFRYCSSWSRSRWGYEASEELLARLNPLARLIVKPSPQPTLVPPVPPKPNVKQ